jgi:hypothetical protein
VDRPLIDPARGSKPKDKPRVERQMAYVRDSLWAGACVVIRGRHGEGHQVGHGAGLLSRPVAPALAWKARIPAVGRMSAGCGYWTQS